MLNEINAEFKSHNGSDPEIKAALKQGLGLPMLSFPAVFVRGAFIGGFEQLQDVLALGRLDSLLSAPMSSFPADANAMPDPLQLTVGPRGQRWFAFQLHVYGNFVRMLSLLHVVLFAFMLAAAKAAPGAVTGSIWVVTADLAIFTLLGPTPLAPICTLVTMFVWRFRGNAVTSLPYKCIIGAAYIFSMASILTCNKILGGAIYQIDQCPKVCGNGGNAECPDYFYIQISTMLLNSTFLAFFRF